MFELQEFWKIDTGVGKIRNCLGKESVVVA